MTAMALPAYRSERRSQFERVYQPKRKRTQRSLRNSSRLLVAPKVNSAALEHLRESISRNPSQLSGCPTDKSELTCKRILTTCDTVIPLDCKFSEAEGNIPSTHFGHPTQFARNMLNAIAKQWMLAV